MSAYDISVIRLRTAQLPCLLLVTLACGTLRPRGQDVSSQRNLAYLTIDEIGQPLSRNRPLRHPIATSSAKTQALFDQGMEFVYGFNFEEAIGAFENASKLDSRAAMPYWGIALANSPSYNSGIYNSPTREKAAFEAIQKAKQFAPKGPNNERAYIDALATRLTDAPNPEWEKLARDYSAVMRELSRNYPDDPDASTLYAESLMDLHPYHLWTYYGQPGEITLEIVAVLEGVLRRWPDHVGANHFYIHAMEASPFPDRALASARRLETLMPSAGHLLHMPAHIYYRTGDYAAAVKSALAAGGWRTVRIRVSGAAPFEV
jgi:tetratricopeptide (TPR) repeat protein